MGFNSKGELSIDPIKSILRALRNDKDLIDSIKAGFFSKKLLHIIAEVYETYGGGGAELYILDRAPEESREPLLKVLRIIDKYPSVSQNRVIGRYIIKTLPTIVNTKEV